MIWRTCNVADSAAPTQIQSQLVQTDAQLKPMVKGVPQTTAECHSSLMKIVSDYCRLLRQASLGSIVSPAAAGTAPSVSSSRAAGLGRWVAHRCPGQVLASVHW